MHGFLCMCCLAAEMAPTKQQDSNDCFLESAAPANDNDNEYESSGKVLSPANANENAK